MPKTFPILLDDELHRRLKHAAIDAGIPLQDWIVKTLKDKVGMEGENDNSLRKSRVKDERKRRPY